MLFNACVHVVLVLIVCVSVCLCVCVFGVYVSVTAVAGSLVPRPPRPAFVLQETKAGRGGLGTRLCSGCYRSFQIQCKVIPSKPPYRCQLIQQLLHDGAYLKQLWETAIQWLQYEIEKVCCMVVVLPRWL